MRSSFRFAPALCVLALANPLCSARSSAQSAADTLPKELVAVVTDVSDIESLRALNPLKLTAEQLGKIEEAVRKAGENHAKKIATAAAPLQAMGPEIRELRKKLLTGGEVPEDFDKRGAKIQEAFVAKREAEKNKTLKSLSDSVKEILTKDQVAKAIAVSKKLTKRDGKPTMQGSDDQFFNFFIQSVLIDYYPNILPLLDEMRKARGEAGQVNAAPVSLRGRQRVAIK